jgi:hypothetical protein
MRKLLLILVLVFHITSTYSQSAAEGELPRFKVSDVYVQGGGFYENQAYSTLADFKKLAPESVLLTTDLTGYDQSGCCGYSQNYSFSVLAGFQVRNSEGTAYLRNPLLRAGFTYISASPYSNGYTKEERTQYDVMTSSNGDIQAYLDSVTYSSLGMEYNSDQLRLDFSAIFRTDPAARWSLYGGAGFNAGLSFNNSTEITYSNYAVTNMLFSNGDEYTYYYPENNDEYITEYVENKSAFSGSLFLPLGLDFRIARKGEFFKRLHLYYEFRPGINITSVPELETEVRSFGSSNFGLRINWEN